MTSPKITVITPFYNSMRFIDTPMNAVLNQTYQNWEYICVDDRSTDGKLEKRTVTTGKVLWGGEYYEIRSGLSVTDQIAFPYGKNVVAGAPTEAGDLSELYGY